MKKALYFVALVAGTLWALSACKTGDYDANTSSAANSSINPLDPLDSADLSAFVVAGASPSYLTATVNGSTFTVSGDTTLGWYLDDTTGTNVITAISGKSGLALYLQNVYATNIYQMGYNDKTTYGVWTTIDTAAVPAFTWCSYLGNSGEVQVLENDAHYIKGTFYFQGINSTGDVINVTNGYFYINKL